MVTSQLGTINNLIQVRKSDFEVFDALQVDSLDSSDTTGQSKGSRRRRVCRHVVAVTQRISRSVVRGVMVLLLLLSLHHLGAIPDLSSSPPGPYGQEHYVFKPEERFKAPPILPPHLLQVILNKDTNISVSGPFSRSTFLRVFYLTLALSLIIVNFSFCVSLSLSLSLSHSLSLSLLFLCSLSPSQCDPALLPEPNHVMLNHLYALSIKVSRTESTASSLLHTLSEHRVINTV